jgi:hypothetical protein
MKIWLVDLEAVETRYTSEWKVHLPKQLKKVGSIFDGYAEVEVMDGADDIPDATTPGAFLNFGGTNIYKCTQIEKLSRAFTNNKVKSGDHIIFTDAWHPGIINVKYMAELLGIDVITHGLWHAGSYDPADFLGRLVGDTPWVRNAEKSFFHAFDHNYFASDFHIKMFCETLLGIDMTLANETHIKDNKIVRAGWPMEYTKDSLTPFKGMKKKNLILFPHRVAPEKQPEIFRDLKETLQDDYEFVVCQDQRLSKVEYHNLLGEAKMIFSANLQETLGISAYEGAVVDTFPLVPDRLSYTEMYDDYFKYPGEWTQDWDSYIKNKDKLVEKIHWVMNDYKKHLSKIDVLTNYLSNEYFSCINIIRMLQYYNEQNKETSTS